MSDHDKWRHVRAVLAARTPDSELLVHRAGGEIVFGLAGRLAKRLAFRVTMMNDDVQCHRDLDALSTLWNVADELLADADALAGARAECQRLRAALALVLDEMEDCEGRQGMWEDGIDPDYRRAIEHGRAALMPGKEGATDGNG